MKIEDAIKRYESWAEDDRIDVLIRKEHRQIANWLKELKADRPQGEWIKTTPWSYGAGMGEVYGYYQKCSNCGKEFMDKSNFCPKCGARMKGADDEVL